MKQAKSLRSRGRLDDAAEVLEDALEEEPCNAHVLTFLAKVEKQRDVSSEKPLSLLLFAASKHPSNHVVQQAAGVECARVGRINDARVFFQNAIDVQPSDGPTLQAWARAELAYGTDESFAEDLLISAGWDSNCLHQLALRHIHKGNTRRASKLLAEAAQADRLDPVPLQSLAELESRRGRSTLARGLLKSAMSRAQQRGDSDSLSCAYCSYGVLERSEGNLVAAHSKLRSAIRSSSCNVHAWSAIAAVEVERSRPKRAVRLAQAALHLNGPHVQLLQVLGNAQRSLCQLERAKASLEQALSIDSANCASLHVFGLVLLELGEINQSREVLRRGAAHNHRACTTELAQLESPLQPGVARELFQQAHDLEPDASSVLRAWALHERKRGSTEDARLLFERAASCDDVSEEVYLQWASLERNEGNITAARKLLSQGLHRFPRSAPLWYAAGTLEQHHGNGLLQAVNLLSQGMDMCPDDPSLRLEMALALWQLGQQTRARIQFTEGAKLRPPHLPLLQAWADFELQHSNTDAATRIQQAVHALEAKR